FIEPAVTGGGRAAVKGSANDRVPGIGEDDLLGGDFGFRINTQGIDGGRFVVVASQAIENEIGGEKKEWNVFGQFGEAGSDLNIQQLSEGGIGLAGLAFAESGAMDDKSGLFLVESVTDDVGVGEVEVIAREAARFPIRSVSGGSVQ